MNRAARRNPKFRKAFAEEQARQPVTLTRIPRPQWPPSQGPLPLEVWRSRKYLVQIYEDNNFVRMSVNRCELGKAGGWAAEITWDELQTIKHECGFGDKWAVECFPADDQVVNVASMRHLWIFPDPPAFGWHKEHA